MIEVLLDSRVLQVSRNPLRRVPHSRLLARVLQSMRLNRTAQNRHKQ